MPKKKDFGENTKAVAAKERKAEAKKGADQTREREDEDKFWADAGEGAKSKAQAKRDEQAKQREDAARKKAEAKRLADEEDAALARTAKKTPSKGPSTPKVTSHQLQLQKEQDRQAALQQAQQKANATKRVVTEDEYGTVVDAANVNREAEGVEARSVEAALAALAPGASPGEDRHPERRARAAFAAYSERELAQLKLDKPGLKQSQYKDMIWKAWQKAPENPLTRVGAQ